MKKEILTVTIIGGGASAHTLIPLLYAAKYHVNLLTRKPDQWSKQIELQYQSENGEVIEKFQGQLSKISSKPEDVITESDVILLCMPVSQYRNALHRIGPHLNPEKKVSIGTVYGQAGFNWMVDEIKNAFGLENIITFCFGLIPWICRIQEYGKVGITYGIKPINIAAVEPREEFDALNRKILEKVCVGWFGKSEVRQADNFLSLTLSVDNQIIHPSRCYGLFVKHGGEWDKIEDIPYFYRDFDQLSADILRRLDADYSKIRESIKEKYPEKKFTYMLDYLTQDHTTNETKEYNIVESFQLSKTLGAIKPPTVKTEAGTWKIDTNHRFFTDDIHYGLCIAKWAADQLAIEVPTIDEIIKWAQELRQEVLIEDGKLKLDSKDLNQKFISGIPHFYGFQTIDDIVD
ncbi:MAG: NAD/NADP octopine/nopaline dehydrogenase family protein [Anaerolineaceae bacterium]|nr:NAD/NADP octopine/nopaline dehydrogenase family protein [Anaerolineaceae bacterium]